jgi:DNA-binding XRE family transcriptional regulator
MTAFIESVTLETTVCYKCACLFAWPAELRKRRLDDRNSFWCPNGHEQHFTGKSEAEKLRDEVQRQKQMREAEEARRRRIEAERDQVSRAHHRMRERVMNGVCPCCNRTFQNLMRHMKTEHAGELNLRTLRTAFGMSQGALAAEIGITGNHVSQHERGKPVPRYAKQAIESWIDRQAVPKEKAKP